MSRGIVDLNTGEIIHTLKHGDRVVSQRAQDVHREYGLSVDNRYDHYMMINVPIMQLILPTLTASEKLVFMCMLPYVQYQTNKVIFPNGRPLRNKHLIEMTGLSKNKLNETLTGMCKANVLARERDGRSYSYYVNPNLGQRGLRVFKSTMKRFEGENE